MKLTREHLVSASEESGLTPAQASRLWEVLLRSVSSFATLFRHVLLVLGHGAPIGKREAVLALSKQIAFDPSAVLQVLDVRERRSNHKNLDVADVFSRYLAAVEQVTTAVDRMLDSDAAGSS